MSDRLRLVLLSALMLFVELALIRWLGANLVYLSYFSNFVLLGSFLGIGIGFLRADAKRDLFRWAPYALATLVLLVLLFPVEVARGGSELIYFGALEPTGLPPWVVLPVVFLAVAGVLCCIAQGVARAFTRFEPLEAYRLDIAGSILGIVAFAGLSLLHAPPVVWGVVAGVFLVILAGSRARTGAAAAAAVMVVGLLVESLQPTLSWSPYYEVTAEPIAVQDGTAYRVSVNGIPHQAIQSSAARRASEPIYYTVYDRLRDNPLQDVLIVGAGNGSDVAIALEQGAERVDAVEIDPRLQQLGEELNPERPYDDPRVEVHIDDGRAFLERTERLYDLIVFALPDSLTLVSAQSSLRLESYLFTREAMAEAREHLRPGGAFAMYNYYREDWLIDRLGATLQEAHGQPPCVDRVEGVGGLALLVASPDEGALACDATWSPTTDPAPAPVSDNYPFLYLRETGLPSLYAIAVALILVASLVAVRAASGPIRRMAPYLDLFFMGVAFLLLETKSVVQFALLFGTTWFVNALVFAGVLLSVLLAIEVARRVRLPHPAVLYGVLLATVAIAFAVPQGVLLALGIVPRFVVAVVLAFAPIFLANLVFAQRFKDVGASTVAFGANLLGAMVGGLLEYSALVVGYRTLLILTALLYGAAFLAGRRHLAGAPA